MSALDTRAAPRLQRCLRTGGVAVFPTDTVYGLGCDPGNAAAVRRLYELKGRPPEQPAAVMFFTLQAALDGLPDLGERERAALQALLPGPVTVLLPNPRGLYPLTGGSEAIGVRVPQLPGRLAALRSFEGPVMQSSANLSGKPAARRLADIPTALLQGADLVLDGGELPGVASTVVDLTRYGRTGEWSVVREGALSRETLSQALG